MDSTDATPTAPLTDAQPAPDPQSEQAQPQAPAAAETPTDAQTADAPASETPVPDAPAPDPAPASAPEAPAPEPAPQADPGPAPTDATPTEPAQSPAPDAPPAAPAEVPVAAEPQPVYIDQTTTRGDADVLHGSFCRIEVGEHAGEVGVFTVTVQADADGYPLVAEVKLCRNGNPAIVDYAHLTPVTTSGR